MTNIDNVVTILNANFAGSAAFFDMFLLFLAVVGVLFAIPWGDAMYIGTTDSDYEGDPRDVAATLEDVQNLRNKILSLEQQVRRAQELSAALVAENIELQAQLKALACGQQAQLIARLPQHNLPVNVMPAHISGGFYRTTAGYQTVLPAIEEDEEYMH